MDLVYSSDHSHNKSLVLTRFVDKMDATEKFIRQRTYEGLKPVHLEPVPHAHFRFNCPPCECHYKLLLILRIHQPSIAN